MQVRTDWVLRISRTQVTKEKLCLDVVFEEKDNCISIAINEV